MSHFTRVRTALRDVDVLVAALKEVGLGQVEVHDVPQTLYGYRGDAREEKAEVIVRRRYIDRLSNDLGFVRGQDGSFDAIISGYDRRRFDAAWMARLTRAYGRAAALAYAEAHGYEVDTDEIEEDGTLRLTLRRVT
jgi:hypothetical protein